MSSSESDEHAVLPVVYVPGVTGEAPGRYGLSVTSGGGEGAGVSDWYWLCVRVGDGCCWCVYFSGGDDAGVCGH